MQEQVSLRPQLLPQSELDINDKRRSNLFAWSGQFSPQLVESLLKKHASPGSVVLDPFVGSGTVMLECARLGLEAHGRDINPAAITMAKIYHLTSVELPVRQEIISVLDEKIHSVLFNKKRKRSTNCVLDVVRLYESEGDPKNREILGAFLCHVDKKKCQETRDIQQVWQKLRNLLLGFPSSKKKVSVEHGDARCTRLPGQSVDLIITSPPYVNVLNYHQQYRKMMEILGWNLLNIAPSEIGANRKHRSNRFLTVIQYCLDMAQVLQEMKRVCKEKASIILIVGKQAQVQKTTFFPSEIVKQLAVSSVGLGLVAEQTRCFKNKFGTLIYEDLLYFNMNGTDSELLSSRDVAQSVLDNSRARVPIEFVNSLKQAIEMVPVVSSSPLLQTP